MSHTPHRFEVERLINGNGDVVEHAAMLVEGKRITAVGRRDEVPNPQGAVRHYHPHSTLMPGLIDSHVHLAYSGSPDKRAFRAETIDLSYAAQALRAASYARASLEAGFIGLRDCHAPGGVIIDLAQSITSGHQSGPRIAACGMGLSSTGGHMDPPGWGDHVSFEQFTAACDGADSYRKGTREQLKRGAHYIKINACHSFPEGSADHPVNRFRREMTDNELMAVADESHMHGRKVAAHAPGGDGVKAAVQAGIDSIEHGHWIDDETLELMAERGTAYVPTLTVNERNFDFTREALSASRKNWDWLLWSRDVKWDTLERARKFGVTVLAGTDAGYMLPHGESNARELRLLVQGGYTPLEAIQAATINAATWLGWHDLGSLVPGKTADFLLVDGDPSQTIDVLLEPSRLSVFQNGCEVVSGPRNEGDGNLTEGVV